MKNSLKNYATNIVQAKSSNAYTPERIAIAEGYLKYLKEKRDLQINKILYLLAAIMFFAACFIKTL